MVFNIDKELKELEKSDLTRVLSEFSMTKEGVFSKKGSPVLNFSSNDYLNLSTNSKIKKDVVEIINRYGCSSCSSPLLAGYFDLHKNLENTLASIFGYDTSMIFGTGFITNYGIINTLANENALIFADKFVHASIIDGCMSTKSRIIRYKHNDLDHLDILIKNSPPCENKFIVTDSLFSMDGDIANLDKIRHIADKYSAFVIVDEAHAIGIFGKNGSGLCNEIGYKPDIIVGTFSKALGSFGGFVVCSEKIKRYLINKCRSYIYSTSLPFPCVAAASASIDYILNEKNLGIKLLKKSKFLYKILLELGFNLTPFYSQIIPVILKDNNIALNFARKLLDQYGILAVAIRPPTIPAGSSRLRLSINLSHTYRDLKFLAQALTEIRDDLFKVGE